MDSRGGLIGKGKSPGADNFLLASSSEDGSVKLWDVANDSEVRTLNNDVGGVLTVAFSPDGHQLAVGANDGTVKLLPVKQ